MGQVPYFLVPSRPHLRRDTFFFATIFGNKLKYITMILYQPPSFQISLDELISKHQKWIFSHPSHQETPPSNSIRCRLTMGDMRLLRLRLKSAKRRKLPAWVSACWVPSFGMTLPDSDGNRGCWKIIIRVCQEEKDRWRRGAHWGWQGWFSWRAIWYGRSDDASCHANLDSPHRGAG